MPCGSFIEKNTPVRYVNINYLYIILIMVHILYFLHNLQRQLIQFHIFLLVFLSRLAFFVLCLSLSNLTSDNPLHLRIYLSPNCQLSPGLISHNYKDRLSRFNQLSTLSTGDINSINCRLDGHQCGHLPSSCLSPVVCVDKCSQGLSPNLASSADPSVAAIKQNTTQIAQQQQQQQQRNPKAVRTIQRPLQPLLFI